MYFDFFCLAYPQVKPMARSKNLVEGKTLELVCRTWGWPLPNITWEREGGLIYDGRVSFPNSTQANLSTLQIEKVTSNDRAVYVCIATSFVNDTRHESNTTILVRVKGQTFFFSTQFLYQAICTQRTLMRPE